MQELLGHKDKYIGRRVWTILKGDTFRIECGNEVIAHLKLRPTLPRDG
jgi:hypothetical protein